MSVNMISLSLTTSRLPRFTLTILRFLSVTICTLLVPKCQLFQLFHSYLLVLPGDTCSSLHFPSAVGEGLKVSWSQPLGSVITIKSHDFLSNGLLLADSQKWAVVHALCYPSMVCVQKSGLTTPLLNQL